jgi:DNA-binding NarL/FixJ family response regulator
MIERLCGVISARRRTAIRMPGALGGDLVADRIADRLAVEGFRVITIVALPELREVPLAAFGPLLADEPHEDGETLADRVHRLYLATAPAKAHTLVVVHDAEHLDHTSAAVLHQLVRTSGVRTLLAGDGPLPDALERLAGADDLLIDLVDLLHPEEYDDLRFEAAVRARTPSTTETLAWAAIRAASGGDAALAVDLARRALDGADARREPRPVGALVTLADALSLSGELGAADAAYAELLTVAEGPDLVSAFDNAAMHWTIRCYDPARAATVLRPVLERVDDPTTRAALETSLAEASFMAGTTAQVVPDEVDQPGDSPAEDPIATMRRLIFVVHQDMYAGNLAAGRVTAQQARAFAELHPSPGRQAGETVEFLWYLMLVVDARLGEAAAHAQAFRARHRGRFNGMWDYAVALPRFLAGDLTGAVRAASRGVTRLAERDVVSAIGPTIGLQATAAAAAGRLDAARKALAALPPNGRQGNVHTDLHASEAEAWLLLAAGEADRAAAVVAAAARRGLDTSHTTFAALTAATAVRFGRPEAVLDLLDRAAEAASGAALVPLLARYAGVAAAGDAEGLVAVARELASAGLLAPAADAASAAAGYDVPGAAELAAGYRGGTAAPVDHLASGLSRQEWAVASAAAERLRNREIAERLGLSVRTVENYLASAFRKLGVSRRDDLADRLRS